MDTITIRYGESLVLPLDTGGLSDVSADMYIGKPGESYVLTKHISLAEGLGTFTFSVVDTQLPLGTYYYQINVTDQYGYVEKYPSPQPNCDECENDFPQFIVCEVLDVTEVS